MHTPGHGAPVPYGTGHIHEQTRIPPFTRLSSHLRVPVLRKHGELFQKDLTKKNKLPSLPCVLSYFPEYKNFTDIKKNMLGMAVRSNWDYQSVLDAGKDYVAKHGKITESSLRSENNLPTSKVVYNYFGTLAAYQQAVGSQITQKNDFISETDIENAVNEYFGENERGKHLP